MADRLRAAIRIGAGLLAVAPLLAGCDSGSAPAAPTTEIALPDLKEAHDAASPYPTDTVTLTVGQSLGVRGRLTNTTAWAWDSTSTGDGAVVRRGPDFVTAPCPEDSIGCSTEGDQVFVAVAPGTTTLSWKFRDRGRCPMSPMHPDPRCADAATKSIRITVRG
ncbi:hypothetical protein ACPC54_40850 [Kitasatospora sp. NPDC094028]